MSSIGGPWDAHAACRNADPELFFPISKTARALVQINEAKAVCGGCEVSVACLEFALSTDATDGIFGGLTAEERQRIRWRERSA